jgi:TPR repeat protein
MARVGVVVGGLLVAGLGVSACFLAATRTKGVGVTAASSTRPASTQPGVVATVAATTQPASPAADLEQAVALTRAGRADEAWPLAAAAVIAQQPEVPQSWLKVAVIALKSGHRAEGLIASRRYKLLSPITSPEVVRVAALQRSLLALPTAPSSDDAIVAFNAAKAIADMERELGAGNVAAAQSKADDAIAQYAKVVGLPSVETLDLYCGLAKAVSVSSNKSMATDAAEGIRRLDPEFRTDRQSLGAVASLDKDVDKARMSEFEAARPAFEYDWFRDEAEGGECKPCARALARDFASGRGVNCSGYRAREVYARAVSSGKDWALTIMARDYLKGLCGPCDKAKATALFAKAAEAGNGYARAVCLMNGWAGRQDSSQGIQCLKEASDAGDVMATSLLASSYETGKFGSINRDMATRYFHAAADGGDDIAMFNIGVLYLNRDFVEAMRWFSKAAGEGNSPAMVEIGTLYCSNYWGVTEDFGKALSWWNKATAVGNTTAMWHIGMLYDIGDGVHQDRSEAIRWYQRSADDGDIDAMLLLGQRYSELTLKSFGTGIYIFDSETPDYNLALKWYGKAAEAGSTKAMTEIARFFFGGNGVRKDVGEGLKWLHRASDAGDTEAMMSIAFLLEKGDLIGKDDIQAMQYYLKAANAGNGRAMYNVAERYENGDGVAINLDEAKRWWQRGANSGDVFCRDKLDLISRKSQNIPTTQTGH